MQRLVDVVRLQVSEAAILGRICRDTPPLMRKRELKDQVWPRPLLEILELNVAPLLALTRRDFCQHARRELKREPESKTLNTNSMMHPTPGETLTQ